MTKFNLNVSYNFTQGTGSVVMFGEAQGMNPGFQPSINLTFPLKPVPAAGSPDGATEAEVRAEAKAVLLAAAEAL
jgi:hypothetical protein